MYVAIKHHQDEQMRELTRRLLQSHDEERRHIARDLHDSTGQNLASLLLTLGRAEREGAQLPPELVEMLSESLVLAEKISGEIRLSSASVVAGSFRLTSHTLLSKNSRREKP